MTTWTEQDGQRFVDAAHDIANLYVHGLTPRPHDVNVFRMLQARREAFSAVQLKPANAHHLTDLEAASLQEPEPAERVGED